MQASLPPAVCRGFSDVTVFSSRFFNCFAFVMVIYNCFAGFIGAIIRVLLSAGISLLLVFRLDKFVLATGYEFMDFGMTTCSITGPIIAGTKHGRETVI